jgi:DNA-binding response OmpR family regulator
VNVLVVQDEAQIASFLKRGLEAEGFAVRVACDGAEGLRLTRSSRFDLIILDLLLPSVSGEEVLARLREGGSNVPVIVLTAKDAVSDRVANLEAGADDYLTKPFSFAELLAPGSRSSAHRGSGSIDGHLLRGRKPRTAHEGGADRWTIGRADLS